MARSERIIVDYERGDTGEYILLVNGIRVSTEDNWRDYQEARLELLEQNLLQLA